MRRVILKDNEAVINTEEFYEPTFPIYHMYEDKISFICGIPNTEDSFEVIVDVSDLEAVLKPWYDVVVKEREEREAKENKGVK